MDNMKNMYFLVLFFLLAAPLFSLENVSASKPEEEKKTKQEQLEHFPPFNEKDKKEISSQKIPSYEGTFAKTIVILIGLILLIFLTIWMFRRMSQGRIGGFQSGKSIRLLEKRPLSPKSMLYLVEINGKKILLAESQIELRSVLHFDSLSPEKDL